MPASVTEMTKKPRTKLPSRVSKQTRSTNGIVEVLTLAEAAKYLRVTESDVLQAVAEQNLPARQVGKDWRILKSAIQQWLLAPPTPRTGKAALKSLSGVWKDDPSVEPMLSEIYRRRGRAMMEAST